MTFQGPTPEMWERYSRASNAPVIMALGLDGVTELNERVIEAREFDALSAEDQALIVAAEREISAGLSETLQQPGDWGGDWAAEDAEFLDDEPEAGDDDEDENDEDAEEKSLPGDDGDWIGV